MTKKQTILEGILEADNQYHTDQSSKIYTLFRKALDLATLIKWSKNEN